MYPIASALANTDGHVKHEHGESIKGVVGKNELLREDIFAIGHWNVYSVDLVY